MSENYYEKRGLTEEEFEKKMIDLEIQEVLTKLYHPDKQEELEKIKREREALEKEYPEYARKFEKKRERRYSEGKSIYERVNETLEKFGINYKIDSSKVEYESFSLYGGRYMDRKIIIPYDRKDDLPTYVHEAYHAYMTEIHKMEKDLSEFGVGGTITEAPAYLLELFLRIKEADKYLDNRSVDLQELGILSVLLKNISYSLWREGRRAELRDALRYLCRVGEKILEDEEIIKSTLSSAIYSSLYFGRNATIADTLAELIVEKFKKYKSEKGSIEEAIKLAISPESVKEMMNELRKRLGRKK